MLGLIVLAGGIMGYLVHTHNVEVQQITDVENWRLVDIRRGGRRICKMIVHDQADLGIILI